jgi:phosphoribosylamine--glycine ligase
VVVVIAAEGYPADPVKGDEITGAERPGEDHAYLLHAGTARNANGALVAAGGRVLNAVGSGPDVATARARAYELAETVSLRGGWYRRDIAARRE